MNDGSEVTTDTEGVVTHVVNWGVRVTLLIIAIIAVVAVLLIVRRVRRR